MKFLSLAALALTIAACSNDENEVIQQQAGQPIDGEITITATITKDDDMTRALSVSGDDIATTWTVGEKVAILFEYKSAKTVREAEVKSVTGGNAYIQFTIPADLTDSQTATLVYPATAVNATKDGADVATALATQDGSITNCPEVRTGTGTLYASLKTMNVDGFLGAQNAIFKFTVQDLSSTNKTATEFKVSDASGNVLTTVTASPASGALYVALPVMASGTYWFNATIGGKPYIAKATLSSVTAAGKYYQSTVKMATVGDVILADGKFAAPSSTGSKVAMIAYLGSETDATYNHGLALALTDANNGNAAAWCSQTAATCLTKRYSALDTADDMAGIANTDALVGHAEHTHAAASAARNYKYADTAEAGAHPTGTSAWFLPSTGQWVKMIAATGGNTALRDGFSGVGGTNMQAAYYWSSTEYNANSAWLYNLPYDNFSSEDKYGTVSYVRACLAF